MSEGKAAVLAANIFLRAAAYIRSYGWQKRGMGVHGAPRCSMGALASAYPEPKWESQLSRLMYRALYDELEGLSLTQFNYKYGDGEKVAELYKQVAAKLRGGTYSTL